MPTRHPSRLSLALLASLLPAVLGCQSTSNRPANVVIDLVQQGQYEAAVVEAKSLIKHKPDDPELQRLLRDAEIALLLSQGRDVSFSGDPERSLEYFREALRLDPDNDVALGWVAKTRVQLAESHLDYALSLTDPHDLDEAEAEFEIALSHIPEGNYGSRVERIRLQAELGLVRVLHLKTYHETLSASQFEEGLRSFREFLLARAKHGFDVAYEHHSGNKKAQTRSKEVDVIMANEGISKAEGLEADGFFHAARNQFRMVLLIDPKNAIAREGLDRTDLEARANEHLSSAQMKIIRGEFEQAAELIEDAGEMTTDQADSVGLVAAELEDARLAKLYETAVGLERDYRYPEAVAAFEVLLEEVGFYEDAVARRDTILEFIQLAEECYANALAATTDEEAASYLRRIPVFWPEYKDVEQRLAAIEARAGDGDGN